jgi:hypothetical protein
MTLALPLPQISVTELYSFRECRRQWYLGNVRKLVPLITPVRFWFGTGWHFAMQGYHQPGGSLEAGHSLLREWYVKSIDEEVAPSYGFLWTSTIQTEYAEMHELMHGMLDNYDQYHRSQNDPWDTIAAEQRVWVPILYPTTRHRIPGSPKLTARLDWMGHRGQLSRQQGVERRGTTIVDHKSAAQQPAATGRDLDIDDQMTGYGYVYFRLTGQLADELIYNTAIKRVPGPPEILKNNTPSKAKDQPTTYGLYMAALTDRGLDTTPYLAVLHELQQEGWHRYFVRESTQRNGYQLEAYEQHLFDTYRDMVEVVKHPERAYPSPSAMRCSGCSFFTVCQAMEDSQDHEAESLIAARFKVSTEERW